MKAATKSAPAAAESLGQVKQRFEQWRANRRRGEHISGELWAAAVAVAQGHGVEETAQELRIDLGGLKRRMGRGPGTTLAAGAPPQPQPQFVELLQSSAFGAGAGQVFGCSVEMENARGGKMRVEVRSLDGLACLAGAFWGAP